MASQSSYVPDICRYSASCGWREDQTRLGSVAAQRLLATARQWQRCAAQGVNKASLCGVCRQKLNRMCNETKLNAVQCCRINLRLGYILILLCLSERSNRMKLRNDSAVRGNIDICGYCMLNVFLLLTNIFYILYKPENEEVYGFV
jgi:hypothetical protein